MSPKVREVARFVAASSATYFGESGREFPWRTERNPYKLAVAEILLQKTRAASVVVTYAKIIARWPTATALSTAPTEDVEGLLLPLGLYKKRAVQLTGMARAASTLGSSIFDDWRVLLADVPGLGAYAARAVVCFSRGEHLGIVDANVARILRRVFRIRTKDSRAAMYQRHADAIALESEDPRATNFGLLDVGAVVCLPKPLCTLCPFGEVCPRYGVKAHIALES